jgi:uncharacterized protein (DUF1684 family)
MTNDQPQQDSYREELTKWRQLLDDNLREEDSWLALADLYWLEEGENSFGTDPENKIVLPFGSAPGIVGNFLMKDGQVTAIIESGVEVFIDGEIKDQASLKADSSGEPTRIKFEQLTFMLLDREGGLGIRLWDNQRPERLNFPGRRWLPVNESLRIEGSFQRYEKEAEITFNRKNGADFQAQVHGEIHFQLEGKEHSLVAIEQEDGSLFTLFFDATSGKESYPAGRFLIIGPPENNEVEIDFNRAYNPPCAFTDYATCPLPPPQNRLDISILAGERY